LFRSLIAVALLAHGTGCSKHTTAAPMGGASIPPSKVNLKRVVELARAERRALVYSVETVGVLEAEAVTDIAAGVKGVVDEVNFREGDLVDPAKKVPLVRIDEKSYSAALKLAEANELKSRGNFELAKDKYNRAQQAGQGLSEQERREAFLNRSIAEAELAAAQSNLDLAKHNLYRSQILPPYKGRINKRMVAVGSYLEDKTVIATIADLSHIRLVTFVPESAVATVRQLFEEASARVRVNTVALPLGAWLAGTGPWASVLANDVIRRDDVPSGYDPEFTVLPYPNRTFRGRVFYLSTVADPNTHMFECKAEVNFKAGDVELKPGFTARVRLPILSDLTACVVPEEAVRWGERGEVAFEPEMQRTPEGEYEWVARVRPLRLGYRAPGFVEVRHGVAPGHWVVRRGAEALDDGTPIKFPDEQLRELMKGQ
jgi:RND family efflux transporter MFP subunit